MSPIPSPNTSGGANPNFVVQGIIPPDGHFVAADRLNVPIENFGGFVYVNPPNTSYLYARTSACSLTVDSALVDSGMVTFQ